MLQDLSLNLRLSFKLPGAAAGYSLQSGCNRQFALDPECYILTRQAVATTSAQVRVLSQGQQRLDQFLRLSLRLSIRAAACVYAYCQQSVKHLDSQSTGAWTVILLNMPLDSHLAQQALGQSSCSTNPWTVILLNRPFDSHLAEQALGL